MKIVYIANSRIPTTKAHGFQIIKMCEAFSKAGVNIKLWIPKRFNSIKDSPFNYYGIKPLFEIKKFPVIDLIPLSRFLGPVANIIESLSFAISVIFNLPKDDSLIYSRDQFVLWFLSFSNRKFTYEVHTFPRKPKFYKRIWRKAHKIVTITNGLKNLIIKQGISSEKILVAPDAVDLAAFNAISDDKEELRIELGLSGKDSFFVGYIGKFKTLGMEKGISTMIESLPLLDKDTKMVFVGGEESEINIYKALASRSNVFSQVLFFGHQPYIKAVKYMKAVDALIIPSPNKPFYAIYSSPLKLFEYMASGRPIIASDLPALREILNDKNALFFKPDDANDLARAIKMLENSQMLGYNLSQQALADVKNYTWDNRAKKILDFIH